ncbi:histidinol-phosphate transaminase [Treponema endosymbiont of Eucomonympha sp.]|uniref:histidinol-phosphate transaminase n=1 Tax=Treponema endosymbiont of Eucomonympha sp. TaxID=1580831 RepID=UPI0007509B58|nr:histidinol-phosphate transaminase [Treponema endosymbiont of Eucomonympha sp.]
MNAKRIARLKPYVPGEQPRDRQYIKLNANENPYPPSPRVAEAIIDALRDPMRCARYPDPESAELKCAIARMLNETGGVLCRAETANRKCSPAERDVLPFTVTPDMVFAGNGSDEVLSFVFYAFFDSDRPLVLPEHTYSFYPVYAGFYGVPLCTVPLAADFSLDADALLAAAHRTDSPVIFANPNAPTGVAFSRDALKDFLSRCPRGQAVVVDEAYADFGGESALPLLRDFPNLAIVRTLSKSFSFAGMRLGFLVASPQLVGTLTTVKNSFNHFPVDAFAQCAGIAACEDAAWYAGTARKIAAERERFSAFLSGDGWQALPSRANFVFARRAGTTGRGLYEKIRAAGILVRHFDKPGVSDFIRVTVGTGEDMRALQEVLAHVERA